MDETVRVRRAPPPFRRVAVRRVERLSPRLARVTLSGAELAGWSVDEPAASVRLLLPTPGETELVRADVAGQRVPPPGRAAGDDPDAHPATVRRHCARARRRHRPPRRRRRRRLGRPRRPRRRGRDLRSRSGLHDRPRRAGLRARRRRDGDPRDQPAARAPARRGTGRGLRRGRRPRRADPDAGLLPRHRSLARSAARCRSRRRPGGRGQRRRHPDGLAGCGRPARRRRCSASAVTSSRSGAGPARAAVVRGYWKHGRAGGDAAT